MKHVLYAVLFFIAYCLSASEIEIKSGYLERVIENGEEKIIIIGSSSTKAFIKIEDKIVQGQKIEIKGKNNRYIQSEGEVKLLDSKNDITITGGSFYYDREEDILKVLTNVYMEDRKNKIVARSEYIESLGRKKIVNLQINVRLFKGDITSRSEFAIYDRDRNRLELFGYPVVHKKNDKYESIRIIMSLDTDEIILEGDVKGMIENTQQEKQDSSSDSN